MYAGDFYGYLFDRKIMIDLYADHQTGPNDQYISSLHSFVVYQTEPVTFGIEVFSGLQNNVKSDRSAVRPFGISLFTRGRIIKDKLNAFARYDSYNPDHSYRDTDAISVYNSAVMRNHYDEQFITAGLDFIPHKNVHIMPNIWINSYKSKDENAILVKRKADIVPRLTFYFIYK